AARQDRDLVAGYRAVATERTVHRLHSRYAAGRSRRLVRQVQPHHAGRCGRRRPARRHHHGRRRDHDAPASRLTAAMKFLAISHRGWRSRLPLLLAVIGPGFITASVDNDAGGIFTYSQAGAQFGYTLLWTMIPSTIALIVVQEMAARLGAVTGKGLSDLIREEFGFRLTFIVMITLVITNFLNVVGEFAGIASSLGLFGWSKYYVVPICAFVVWR